MGRLVLTHSTYVEGLVNFLKKLSLEDKIKTITPGVIRRTKGRSDRLQLKVTTKTISGFKVLAKKGSSIQEVFINTKVSTIELEEMIKKNLKRI